MVNSSARKSITYFFLFLGMGLACSNPAYASETSEVREFYIKTVHIDGNGNINGDDKHPAEAYPTEKLPEGRGLQLTEPNEYGAWRIRAFTFEPSQIVVRAGDDIRLNFLGVQGTQHVIHVEGQDVDEKVTLKRGLMKTVDLKSVKEGVIEIECYDHPPYMKAEVLVLP